MKYKYILFDLDGTLTDSQEGITKSVKYALASVGIEENDHSKLIQFVGPPLINQFMTYGNYSEEYADMLVQKFRERFSTKGVFENKLFDNIPCLLEKLKNSGLTLAVATCKPQKFTDIIVNHFNIEKYFDVICGTTLDSSLITKAQVISKALSELKITDKENVVMIGDRSYDVNGATENNIDCIGVSYGYGTEKELNEAGAVSVAHSVMEIADILL